MTDADYVVIGGGSAGAVVASRLSEEPGTRVVLLEAGGLADSFLVRMPAGFTRMLNNPQFDWCYGQDPDDTIGNRKFVWSAGKLLGGSSSINGQVYIRGSVEDHQRWVEQGCSGWSFADCLPHFMASEKFAAAPSPYHGTSGPLSVIAQRDPHPLSRTFVEACAEKGIASIGEYCGGSLGIGPARELTDLGIPVVLDRQQVGQNLQEHSAVPINKFVNVPTYNSQTGPLHMAQHALQYFLLKKGPMVTPAVQAMATARTRPDLAHPNVQLHFLPLSYDIEPQTTSASSGQMDKRPTVMISASVCHPFSRGAVKLRSPRTEDLPHIAHRLLSDSRDVETLSEGCNLIESIFASRTWQKFVTAPRSPPTPPAKTSDWEPYVRSHATIAYHPVGTCRMGSDDESVVDTQLRVRGIGGLRVADASVIPSLVSINTNATAIMVGERAAAFIRGS
jgi:choline dehydrogenase-like flavoprotein